MITTRIRKLADDTFAVYGWDGRDWFVHRVCGSLRAARNAQSRLRRILVARAA